MKGHNFTISMTLFTGGQESPLDSLASLVAIINIFPPQISSFSILWEVVCHLNPAACSEQLHLSSD